VGTEGTRQERPRFPLQQLRSVVRIEERVALLLDVQRCSDIRFPSIDSGFDRHDADLAPSGGAPFDGEDFHRKAPKNARSAFTTSSSFS